MPAQAFVPGRSAAVAHRSLSESLNALEHAQQCAVLWFGDIMRRGLYRELGYSSINQYAQQGLGFSKTRCGDFVRLAARLEALPEVRASVARGEIGYTKAREIVKVATPKTERAWLQAASGSRRALEVEVARARRAAVADPRQGKLVPAPAPVAVEVPVRFAVELTPEQEARRAALWERLRKLGGVPADRGEVLLEALAALVEEREAEGKVPRGTQPAAAEVKALRGDQATAAKERAPRGTPPAAAEAKAPRGIPPAAAKTRAPRGTPHFQIHVHQCPDCGKATVATAQGERELSAADAARARCDAHVAEPGQRNQATIPPRVRRQVLARDRHRCQAPGCDRTRFLEVHHRKPRRQGGGNDPENLVTLCAACHRSWHERRAPVVAL